MNEEKVVIPIPCNLFSQTSLNMFLEILSIYYTEIGMLLYILFPNPVEESSAL